MKKLILITSLIAILAGCVSTPTEPPVAATSEAPSIRYKAEGCKGVMQITVDGTAYYYQIPKELLCRSI